MNRAAVSTSTGVAECPLQAPCVEHMERDAGEEPGCDARRAAVICLAAGPAQLAVIRAAQRLGFAVIAVDRNPQAPGFRLSDERLVLSTYEAGPIIAALDELRRSYRIRGVVNRASGPPVVTAAEISAALDLPGPPPQAVRILMDKSQLMPACAAAGIPTPRCQSAAALADIDLAAVRFPCVVKPALSSVGKAGVSVVQRPRDLPAAFGAAREAAVNGLVNIEEYVAGQDVSLISVVHGCRAIRLALIDEINTVDGAGRVRPLGVAAPSVLQGTAAEPAILGLARQIVRVFRLDRTALLIACRCEAGGKPRLIEVHLDLGGDGILDALLPASTPVDVLGLMVRVLGGEAPPPAPGVLAPAAVLYASGPGRPARVVRAESRDALGAALRTMAG